MAEEAVKTPAPKQKEEEGSEEPEMEESDTGGEETKPKGISGLMTPEGLAMMMVAGLLDLTGLLLFAFALDDFGVTDVVGILSIGLWMFMRSGSTKPKKNKGLAKLFRGKWKRFFTPLIGESIPYLGVLPSWTLAVYYELTG